jgi:co-chaperonin GroES (HSP10)
MYMNEHFLVRIPKRFKDTINVAGKELYLDSRFDEFNNRINHGEVVAVPRKYDTGVSVGDTLYFHHHVVVDKGQKFQYEDDATDVYIVYYNPQDVRNSQAIAYKHGDQVHELGWILLEPMEEKKEEPTSSGIILVSYEEKPKKEGRVAFANGFFDENGVVVGDVVGFLKNRDYEIEIDGKNYWRMRHDDIVYVRQEA